MTRLINPGDGDKFDRATILLLKLQWEPLGSPQRVEWQNELDDLSMTVGLTGVQVAQINARVWEREDEIRFLGRLLDAGAEYRTSMIREHVAALALGTRKLNDRKHEILETWNGYAEKVRP